MGLNASLQTERLLLVPLTLPQLQLYLTNLPALEAQLGLSICRDIITERVQRAIKMKIDKMTALDESMHSWQTYWLIIVSAENVGAGLAGLGAGAALALAAALRWPGFLRLAPSARRSGPSNCAALALLERTLALGSV